MPHAMERIGIVVEVGVIAELAGVGAFEPDIDDPPAAQPAGWMTVDSRRADFIVAVADVGYPPDTFELLKSRHELALRRALDRRQLGNLLPRQGSSLRQSLPYPIA